MSSIAKTSISLSKKDLTKSRIPPVASRSVVFYHRATAGQITINLNSLTMPPEMPTQVQATNDEISGARLTLNKKNLSLVSSSNGQLIQGIDYLVVNSYTLKLIGPYASVGAELNEIFVGTIVNSPISDLQVVSARDIVKTTTVAIGQTTVNLGNEYKVGANPLESVGAVKIWINGVLALRDQDYTEVDSGNGFGSTIELLAAPVLTSWQLVADFGVRAVTDQDALGAIESLTGSMVKLATDLADVAGTDVDDYLTANPSDVERRTFGDMVLGMLNIEVPVMTDWIDFPDMSAGVLITATTANPTYGTVATNKAQWRRVGSNMEIRWDYRQTTAGTAGTGSYLFNLPAGYQMDVSKVSVNTTLTSPTGLDSSSLGTLRCTPSTILNVGYISAYSSTQLKGFFWNSATTGVWGPATFDFAIGANAIFSLQASVPIQGWSSTQTIRDILGL